MERPAVAASGFDPSQLTAELNAMTASLAPAALSTDLTALLASLEPAAMSADLSALTDELRLDVVDRVRGRVALNRSGLVLVA